MVLSDGNQRLVNFHIPLIPFCWTKGSHSTGRSHLNSQTAKGNLHNVVSFSEVTAMVTMMRILIPITQSWEFSLITRAIYQEEGTRPTFDAICN